MLERTDIKQALYRKLEAVRRPGSAISSNTSTIALKVLTEGMSEAFRRDFLITHFFNPPRYMRLLEIVAGPETAPETVAAVAGFADVALGKSVVRCEDSPGFIANRLGIYWLQVAVNEAIDLGLTVEEADADRRPPDGHSEDRRVRADGPRRDRSGAARECLDARCAAEVGRIPRRRPRTCR